jgi:hypothetical protein
MPVPLMAVAAGASALGGIGNFIANMSAADRAAAMQSEAMQQWLNLNVPDPADQQVIFQKFVNEGQLDPVLEQAIAQDPSAFEKIQSDQASRQAQRRALAELENIGYSGGVRLSDRATLNDLQDQASAKARADRQNIDAEMARRGMANSGFSVASRLAANQAAADRNADSSLKVAGMAQDRALQAIMQAGELGGQINRQDFDQQAQKAQAADRINQFNTQNLRDVMAQNVAARNRAQEMNLANRQDISNKNVNLGNQQQQYNKELIQQNFENQAKKIAGSTGMTNAMAQTELQKGQAMGNMFSNLGQAGTGFAAAQDAQNFSDNRYNQQRKDMQDAQARDDKRWEQYLATLR